MANMVASTLTASIPLLSRTNVGILNHKLLLMNVMRSTFGLSEAKNLYQQVCPIVHASIGQHIRHSMDHIELAAHAALNTTGTVDIHYDLRARGGPDEHDMDMAEMRIQQAIDQFSRMSNGFDKSPESPQAVDTYFMLSGDPQEFRLPSTIQRELGFAVHHAIHHMALVKIIARETLKIPADALPSDFGRAPSTVVFDKRQEAETLT
jgi:hypothetical protein